MHPDDTPNPTEYTTDEWKYNPHYPADDWSEEADEILRARQDVLNERIYLYLCRSTKGIGLCRISDINHVGIDEIVCGVVDKETARIVQSVHQYSNYDDETWTVFQAREDVWSGIAELCDEGRIEWVIHNGWPWVFIPEAATVAVEAGIASDAQKERASRIVELRQMPYADYLQTSEWRERRQLQLEHAGNRCQVCNRKSHLHVHHRTYKRRGAEKFTDLIVLCADCHQHFHDKLKVR